MEKDEIIKLLRDNLAIAVRNGDFTNPNTRTVKIFFAGEVIAEDYFDVVQKREYEG